MKAVVIDGAFGLENLKVVERDVPAPGPGQVLVRMAAASLNYRDLLMVKGAYNPRQPLPLIPPLHESQSLVRNNSTQANYPPAG